MSNKISSRAEVKQDKKELILAAGKELFLEKGYANTRIIDIAEKAGIGKGTVYAYFESKEDIMVQIIRDIMKKDNDLFNYAFEPMDTFEERLLKYMSHWEKMIESYGLYAIMFKEQIMINPGVNCERVEALAKEMSRAQYMRLYSMIKDAMEKGEIADLDANHTAIFTMTAVGTYMMSLMMAFRPDEGFEIEFPGAKEIKGIQKEEIVAFILNGIGASRMEGKNEKQ